MSEGAPVRVLVVDDSAFVRRALLRMFDGSADIDVVGFACDGETAVTLVKELRPDVVTLDVQMPVMDGLTALSRIMAECPTPVVMLSSCTGKGGERTMAALELGAVDFVDKCSVDGPMEITALAGELTEKILMAARVKVPIGAGPTQLSGDRCSCGRSGGDEESEGIERPLGTEVVVIGTSTGGPAALTTVIGRLPADFPCPLLVVQHMPAGFTAPLAERLDRISAIAVKEAEAGERLVAGCVYIAPAGVHLKVRRSGEELVADLDEEPAGTAHCPSVDVLFASAAEVCGAGSLAFVLTGMGRDGVAGATAIKAQGGKVFVESEESSVVWGMPRAVAAAVTVDGSLSLPEVVGTILRHV